MWSSLTAATGPVGDFVGLLVRLQLGAGEAIFARSAHSVLINLYPASRRGRATGLLYLGLPPGMVLALCIVVANTESSRIQRTASFFAAVPDLVVEVLLVFIREPVRRATEFVLVAATRLSNPSRWILCSPTVRSQGL